MKMSKLLLISALLLLGLASHPQIINMNPDPNGPVWASGGAMAPVNTSYWNIIEFTPNQASYLLGLAPAVDNSVLPFFPYIKNQEGNSCVQMSEVWYIFTYEINRRFNDTAANLPYKDNIFHNLYTYNYLNQGSLSNPTYPLEGFRIIYENGIPDWPTYDDPGLLSNSTKFKYWMTGYEKYKSGMSNTVSKNIFKFSFSYDTAFIYHIKHWIADHGNASATGGLLEIGIYTAPLFSFVYSNTIPAGSPHAGEHYISSLGNDLNSGHALTIAGYNDDILIFDKNGDGQYTTNIDIDNNDTLDIRDYEKGAFKIANSWGTDWFNSNNGYIWMPYNLFHPLTSGFTMKHGYSCDVFGETGEMPQPAINLKVNLEHDLRDHIICSTGYAPAANTATPLAWDDLYHLTYRGGFNSMRGCFTGPIDMGIAFSHLYNPAEVGKVFFKVSESNTSGTSYHGKINTFTLVDNRWGEDFELPCNQSNIPVPYNGEITLSVDYHLLPHVAPISQNLSLTSNRISRFSPTVSNGAKLTLTNEAQIDMYNSEIHIDQGSTLELGSNTKIIAKRGNCKIVVDGNILVSNGVLFEAQGDAQLEIVLNNSSMPVNMLGIFKKCLVTSYAQNVIFQNCQFLNCPSPAMYRGNVNFTNCTFENTGIYTENDNSLADAELKIEQCNFDCNNQDLQDYLSAIDVSSYGKYLIYNNTIQGFYNGIQLFYSGGNINGNKIVKNCTISACSNAGIEEYNTNGIIENNHIFNCNYGVRLMNNSNIELKGNPNAITNAQTQQILDNASYEVYASQHSFPFEFKNNVIQDEDNIGNPSDPMVFYDRKNLPPFLKLVVINNCWGINFSPDQDLKTAFGVYKYYPTWCPSDNGFVLENDELLYKNAVYQYENGDFDDAKKSFQLLISTYPESIYAQAAMRELFVLEQNLTANYSELKLYYQTDISIVSDTLLASLGEIISNDCEIKEEHWQESIDWYENRIINSTSAADSIYAIIDLGHLYFIIDNQGLKSGYTSRLNQFKPKSKETYYVNRSYLLSLLPISNNKNVFDNGDINLANGSLMQNVPNPFYRSTEIWYKIEKQSLVNISITDLSGKEIKKINQGIKSIGTHKIDFTDANLAPGTYFCNLIINGLINDTKKISVIKR
jgi:hypothetical protein